MSADDYALLGVAYGVSPEAARAAFRRIALRLHPDKNPAADATEKYLEVTRAYEAILRASDKAAEADALLADPLADLFGAGWARSFAEGSADPTAVMEGARARAKAELGAADPMAAFAADLGLDDEALADMLASARLGDSMSDEPAESEGNPFKAYFDTLPEAERGPMMALFEKTFPAFLARELEGAQLEAENAIFEEAVARGALAKRSALPPSVDQAVQGQVELINAEAIAAFQAGQYAAAADALTRAVALDPTNPSLYGNRSLARERLGIWAEALEDAESSLHCDPQYVPGYERKGRALLGLQRYAEAEAAMRRGLVIDPEHAELVQLVVEAAEKAEAAKLEIVRAGKVALGDGTASASSTLPSRALR